MKKKILGMIIGVIITGTFGISAATYLYNSNQVSYSNSSSNATDVKGAIDELYRKVQNLKSNYTISGTPSWKQMKEKYDYSVNYVMFQQNIIYLFDEPVDLTDYKYLVLIYRKYTYYTTTLGMGVINNLNATLADCQNISTKSTISWTGNSLSNNTIEIMYLDISTLKGTYYPFLYLISNMYSGYYYFYLTKDTVIPTI